MEQTSLDYRSGVIHGGNGAVHADKTTVCRSILSLLSDNKGNSGVEKQMTRSVSYM